MGENDVSELTDVADGIERESSDRTTDDIAPVTTQETTQPLDGVEAVINPIMDAGDPTNMIMAEENGEDGDELVVSCDEISDDEMARREIPKYTGLYVQGSVHGVEANLTVDSGATSTLVSAEIYDQIPDDRKPKLYKAGNRGPKTANGQPIACRGRAVITLDFGPMTVRKLMWVTETEDDVLVGNDILLQDESGPADIIASKGHMILRGYTVPLYRVGLINQVRRVYAADHFIIPGMSEAVLDAHVDRSKHASHNERLLVEGTKEFSNSHYMAVAPSIVNADHDVTVKIRVINPFDKPVSVKQDTAIGTVTPVYPNQVTDFISAEDESEDQNNNWAKPIKMDQPVAHNELIRRSSEDEEDRLIFVKPPPAHLTELFNRTSTKLSRHQKAQYSEALWATKDGFSAYDGDLGTTHLVNHRLPMPAGTIPVRQRPRPLPLALKGEDEKAVKKLLDQGVARPSSSPWASPIVLVRKKDGTVRACCDYRKLNQLTQKDAHPLPRTQDCLDALAGSTLWSTLDISSAYHQVPVADEDIPKTAVITRCGLFEFTKMPFGLTGATATFQRMMELALSGLQWKTCVIFVDDVIVFGRNFEEHLEGLKTVLFRIIAAGLKLKPSKCNFFQESVVFLGHKVSKDGILPDEDNVKKIKDMPAPKTQTEVKSYLGMCSYYRRWIRSYSEIAHALIQLTKQEHDFEWTPECQEAFEKLKSILTGPEIMAYPQDEGEYILDTDASAIAIGGVLSQIQDGRERVIAYGSKMLSRSEKNWCITDRELYAIRYFSEYYRQYLIGRKYVVRSDHQALKWLFSLKEPKNRIARWIEALSEFDFSVEFRSGKRHGNADGLSRCVNPRDCQCDGLPDDEGPLQCGPCSKCLKRTADMEGDEHLIRRVTPEKQKRNWFQKGMIDLWRLMLMVITMLSLFTLRFDYTAAHKQKLNPKSPPKSHQKGGETIIRRVMNRISTPLFKLGRGSRTAQVTTRSTNKVGWAMPYSMKQLRRKQLDDEDLRPVVQWMEAGKHPSGPDLHTSSPATRHYVNYWNTLKLRDGVLFREFHKKDDTGTYLQFLVPTSMRKEVLHEMHGSLLSGHLGTKKSKEKLLQRFYWHGCREDVNIWVMKCHECGATKTPSQTIRAPLGEMKVGGVLDRLATDVMGPLPETPRGNKYILVVTDHFTSWVEIFPVPDQTAVTCAEKILNEVIARFGCPFEMLSDQGRNYESRIFAELCSLLEIKKIRTSPGNPRCNGKAERFNRTLIRMIKAYLKGEQREWDRNLGCLAAAYRATPNETSGLTPNLLMLGREVRLPAEIMFGSGTTTVGEQVSSYGEYVEKLKTRMQHAHHVARQHLQSSARRQKQNYDAKQLFYEYEPGELVWCLTDISQLDIAPKLRKPYEGPYVVLDRYSKLDYLIQFNDRGKKKVMHHNRLKPYEGNQEPRWAKSALNKYRREQAQQ